MNRRRRKSLTSLAAAAVVLAAAGAWILWPVGRDFDPAAWNDPVKLEQGVRFAMADRIVARRTLSGMTRAQVVSMLGDPPDEGYFRDWHLVYRLGSERGYMSVDSEWLVVRFDANDQVADYRIMRD